MTARANYQSLGKESIQALLAFDKTLTHSKLEKTIIHLVKIRASQLNGCLFCLDMHSKEAKVDKERELRLYHLPLWQESPLFTAKEKAALLWTESLTKPSHEGISDDIYEKVAASFSDQELTELTLFISSINAWNRLGIAFRSKPGSLDKIMGLDKAGLE